LLLNRSENLELSARKKLDTALELNKPLSTAYLLKEELGLLWQQADGRAAWGFLRSWCAKAKASAIQQLSAMANTLLRHARGILSYYKTKITSAMVEGINRKIRGLLAAAYGIRDMDFLKLRLYALHESKWKFVG
jgi:transposase